MTVRRLSTGSAFEQKIGYSRVVMDGDTVLVSGTAGFDYAAGTIAEDAVEQTEQTIRNIRDYLAMADATLADVVRATIIVTDAAHWPRIVPVIGRHFGDVRPTMTAFVAGLVDPRMKVEIEVAARRSPG